MRLEDFFRYRYVAWLKYKLFKQLGALFVNWFSQGIAGYDKTELLFRLILEALVLAIGYSLLITIIAPIPSIALSVLLAHTFNWLFNCHPFVVFTKIGLVKQKDSCRRIFEYIQRLQKKLAKRQDLFLAFVHGSFVRGGIDEFSDLDIVILRKPGLSNALKVCSLALSERSIAFVRSFPLDLMVMDKVSHINVSEDPDQILVIYSSCDLMEKLVRGQITRNMSRTKLESS